MGGAGAGPRLISLSPPWNFAANSDMFTHVPESSSSLPGNCEIAARTFYGLTSVEWNS